MTDEILFSQHKHIGLVTLNRPYALNALTYPMILALYAQLQAWHADHDVHAVVVRAAGDKAFCAGGDVRAIYQHGPKRHQESMDFFRAEYALNQLIHDLSKPYIALMDGITMGGGVGISLHGSHPVASQRFLFAMPETAIGFYPDVGASHLLSRCPGHFGVYLGLTGRRLHAADAQALGLVKYIIAHEVFPDVLSALVDCDLSNDAHSGVDHVLRGFLMPTPLLTIDAIIPDVDACFQHTDMPSIINALNHVNDDWHRETRHALALKSPLSLSVTLAQLHRAKSMGLDACLMMDLGLTGHFMRDFDFYEGVRALLVDKDNTPHWQPATLADVRETMISDYFQ